MPVSGRTGLISKLTGRSSTPSRQDRGSTPGGLRAAVELEGERTQFRAPSGVPGEFAWACWGAECGTARPGPTPIPGPGRHSSFEPAPPSYRQLIADKTVPQKNGRDAHPSRGASAEEQLTFEEPEAAVSAAVLSHASD
jgi:hypothetical protein